MLMNTLTNPTTETARTGFSLPNLLLRLEGVAIFVAAIALYAYLGASGWLFVALLLVPDVSAIGYLRSKSFGALTYNLAHTEILPIALAVVALIAGWTNILPLALIWLAHIGMDRAVGYGLKYPTAFKETHIQRL